MSPSERIRAALIERIEKGLYPRRLPAMRALAGEFSVNLKTIQKVIGRLKEEGLVTARRGSAVYVHGAVGGIPISVSKRRKRKPGRKTNAAHAGRRVGFVCDAYGRGSEESGYHPYFSEVFRGVQGAARKERLDLRFIPTPSFGYLGRHAEYFQRQVLEPGLEGIISLSPITDEVRRYAKHGLRFVLSGDHLKIPAGLAGQRVPRFFHPWDEDVALGMRKLIAAGHRRIAFVGRKGRRGFRQALGSFNLRVPDSWEAELDANSEKAGYEACRRYLALTERPTAFLVTDDFTCRGVLMALLEARVAVPAELSILSLANAASDLHVFRPISTLEVDGRREGAKFVAALLREFNRAGEGRAAPDCWPLHARFVDRGSIAPLS